MYTPNHKSSLKNWLHYIEHIHHQRIELDLSRIHYVAQKLNLLKPTSFVFTVAGTNGKGTTCRTLEILLLNSGYRVGVYSSPHLLSYTERVRIQGRELSEDIHCTSFADIESARNNISLTYFEFVTLSAINIFSRSNIDVMILEVGMGGRLDATNIINADIAIITNIALDHMQWLGKDREKIGREKAGIFRYNKPAIVGGIDIPGSIIDVALEKKALLLQSGRDWQWKQVNQDVWILEDQKGILSNLPITNIPLSNVAAALTAIRCSNLKVSENIIRQELPFIKLPGRFEIIKECPRVILDVAHNPHAATYLATRLFNEKTTRSYVHIVIGIVCDKDINGILSALEQTVDFWYCCSVEGERSTDAEVLIEKLKNNHNNNTQSFSNISMAWKEVIKRAGSNDIILVCGSFYIVAQVKKLLMLSGEKSVK